jgi:hypothetical protein
MSKSDKSSFAKDFADGVVAAAQVFERLKLSGELEEIGATEFCTEDLLNCQHLKALPVHLMFDGGLRETSWCRDCGSIKDPDREGWSEPETITKFRRIRLKLFEAYESAEGVQ